MKSLFIVGNWQQATGEEFVSTNPATGEVLWEGREALINDVDQAIKAAGKAFGGWSAMTFVDRLNILKKYRELLEEEKEDFAGLISRETGKPHWECLLEVGAMIGKLAISVNAYTERCPQRDNAVGDAQAVLRFRPIGPLTVFGPFNLPAHLPNGHIIPALLAGNTIVFKPSEQTPASGQKLVELLDRAGLPAGVVNLVQGARVTGEALADHPDSAGILFTGSYRVGRILHEKFGGHPEKMMALEMGGNNALLVTETKDLQAAAYMTIQSAFITSGQRCVCARRLIVPAGSEGDAFLKELCRMTENISWGDPANRPEPFMGPLISEAAANHVLMEQQTLLSRGAKPLFEMRRDSTIKSLLSPGIVDVTGLLLGDDEIFGPLLQVIRTPDFNSALEEVNNTAFGLSAGILTDNKELYMRFLSSCRAGIINWNRQITGAVSSNPFGGSGLSGNFRPSAYFAADYCAYPVSSIEKTELKIPENISPGLKL